MKQKMSRISGVGCVAAAFANGPGAELLLRQPLLRMVRGLSCSPASLFYEWPGGQNRFKNF